MCVQEPCVYLLSAASVVIRNNTCYVFLIHYLRINQSNQPMTSEYAGKGDHGPVLESGGIEHGSNEIREEGCASFETRVYMEHGGRLLANCILIAYHLPIYRPYNDHNHGLWGFFSSHCTLVLLHCISRFV